MNLQKSIISISLTCLLASATTVASTVLSDEEYQQFSEQRHLSFKKAIVLPEDKTKGYSDNAFILNHFNKRAISSKSLIQDDPYFAQLRTSSKAFKTTFDFNETVLSDFDVMGYAPSGTVVDGSWTGLTAYFKPDSFKTCKLFVLSLSNGAHAVYNAKDTTFEINGKPVLKHVEGNQDSGFIYEVTWGGELFDHELTCASKQDVPDGLDSVTNLARQIDS